MENLWVCKKNGTENYRYRWRVKAYICTCSISCNLHSKLMLYESREIERINFHCVAISLLWVKTDTMSPQTSFQANTEAVRSRIARKLCGARRRGHASPTFRFAEVGEYFPPEGFLCAISRHRREYAAFFHERKCGKSGFACTAALVKLSCKIPQAFFLKFSE